MDILETRVNYVVATYGGDYHKVDRKEWTLNEQLVALSRILRIKKDSNSPCLVKQVTIVCPPIRKDPLPNYYNRELWEYVFSREFPFVSLVFMDYSGPNGHASYDQWLQAHDRYPSFDFQILMEDDYQMSTTNPNFDLDLVRMHRLEFPGGLGYLASSASRLHGHPYHAAVSVGIVSTASYTAITKKTGRSLFDSFLLTRPSDPQLKFSAFFVDNGVPLRSLDRDYTSLFWSSVHKRVQNLSSVPQDSHPLFVPVQVHWDTLRDRKSNTVGFYVGSWLSEDQVEQILHYAVFNILYLRNNSVIVIEDGYKTGYGDILEAFRNVVLDTHAPEALPRLGCRRIFTLTKGSYPKNALKGLHLVGHKVEGNKVLYSDPVLPPVYLPPIETGNTLPALSLCATVGVNGRNVDATTRDAFAALQDSSPIRFIFWGCQKEDDRFLYTKTLDSRVLRMCDACIYTGIEQELLQMSESRKQVLCPSHLLPDPLIHKEIVCSYVDIKEIPCVLKDKLQNSPSCLHRMFSPDAVMVMFKKLVFQEKTEP